MKKIHRKKTDWQSIIGYSISGFALLLMVAITGAKLHRYILQQPEADDVKVENPGELVDKAMTIPGAVVLTPHRDLAEIGFTMASGARVGSPSIAVRTKKGFCVWELGNDYLIKIDSSSLATGDTLYHQDDQFISSHAGYQLAYDEFSRCVAEGNGK